MDPVKRSEYEEVIALIVSENRVNDTKELTRENVLDSVRRLEQAKLEAQQKMYELVRRAKLPPNVINNVIKVEELKAGDKFFIETGIEECDVEPNMKRLGMMDDEECKAIIAEYAAKSKQYLDDKKAQTVEMVKRMKAHKTQAEMAREKTQALTAQVKAQAEAEEEAKVE